MFSNEENKILSSIFIGEIIAELEFEELIIIERIMKNWKNLEIEKSLQTSHRGYYNKKEKIKSKLQKYYQLMKG